MSIQRKKTVDGKEISIARIFLEGGYWRWQIIDVYGTEYTDGGNFLSHRDAAKSLQGAFDDPLCCCGEV